MVRFRDRSDDFTNPSIDNSGHAIFARVVSVEIKGASLDRYSKSGGIGYGIYFSMASWTFMKAFTRVVTFLMPWTLNASTVREATSRAVVACGDYGVVTDYDRANLTR
jgi:hypothetical protein